MSNFRITAYTVLVLLSFACILLACECFIQDYKVAACDYYTLQPDGTLVFKEQLWIEENCGCEDLEARFLQMSTGLQDDECITCEHPYDVCQRFTTCPQ